MKEKYREVVFIVTYSIRGSEVYYLVLKRKKHWRGWEFPKGGIEEGERMIDAVVREIFEETGIKISKSDVKKFGVTGKYTFKRKFTDYLKLYSGQSYSLYSAEVKDSSMEKVVLGHEHASFGWFKLNDALKKLTHPNQRKCLRIVDESLVKVHGKKKNKFRVKNTSSGKLILIGKDASNNEEIVKQTGKDEFVLHTVASGSPFANIKAESKDVSDRELYEAAVFCARYSQDWRDHKGNVKVHVFRGGDVLKKEGMKTGTFSVSDFKIIKVKRKDILMI